MRGAEASNELPRKGGPTINKGKTRGTGRVGWEMGEPVEERRPKEGAANDRVEGEGGGGEMRQATGCHAQGGWPPARVKREEKGEHGGR